MKKNIVFAGLCLMTMSAAAQETYESAQLMTEDLNGTARYIGMGGAMEALGADISTMGTNPAGTGLFRRSWIGFSAGATAQKGDKVGLFEKNGANNADMNQAGFVYVNRVGSNSSINFGFNYHKSRNFNQIMTAVNSLNNASANKGTYIKYAFFYEATDPTEYFSRNEMLHYNCINDRIDLKDLTYRTASAYGSQTENSGYISDFDFNFSGNINDQIYLGLTLGIKDVHYRSNSYYGEDLLDDLNEDNGYYSQWEERKITGTGFNLKGGAIFRPMEDSPFRIGVYVHTPTWYELTCSQHLDGKSNMLNIADDNNEYSECMGTYTYDYKITTPWKFGVSLGHTFGKYVALGATYEYADYGITTNRVKTGVEYDNWGYYSDTYDRDRVMDKNTKEVLKGVSLLKVGMELKPIQCMAIRLGYNYQSAIYDKNGMKGIYDDGGTTHFIDAYYSDGCFNSSSDFTNWKATQRFTVGLGFNICKDFTLDLSYQYATQKGDYHPFTTTNINKFMGTDEITKEPIYITEVNNATVTEVKNNRHQFNCTLGFRF